ncbi:MAG: chorismate-binding protein [Deltaproteobacteria bacterium]|nr:chorismate-binding protein [Deltaproteobacteria bacterium]
MEGPFEKVSDVYEGCVVLVTPFRKLSILSPATVEIHKLERHCETNLTLTKRETMPFTEYEQIFKEFSRYLNSGQLKKVVITVCETGTYDFINPLTPYASFDDRLFFMIESSDFVFFGLTPDKFMESVSENDHNLYVVAGTSTDPQAVPETEIGCSTDFYKERLPSIRSIKRKIVKAGKIFHLQNVINFRSHFNYGEFLTHLYPPSTIFGDPFELTQDLKSKLNPVRFPWGVLLGYRGVLSDDLVFRSIICIRGILLAPEGYYIIAGSGVLPFSDPLKEYEECLTKIEAVKASLNGNAE